MTKQNLTDAGEEPSAGNASRSRALVVIDGPRLAMSGHDRPQADFVAQLIACDRRLPAYRQSRRAAPDDAANAYGRTAAPLHARLDCLV
jgi:hypothetical protein